jgi:hypothetical protein
LQFIAESKAFEALDMIVGYIQSNEEELLPRPRAIRRLCYALAATDEHINQVVSFCRALLAASCYG